MQAVAGSSYLVADQTLMSAATNYFAWQAKLVKPHLGNRVLEVGCGLGNFTQSLGDREVLALDCDPECVARITQRLPGIHAEVCEATELEHSAAVRRFGPDSIVCLNVLEHVEDDRCALESMWAVLPRGGVAVLIVPAFNALYGPIDRNLDHFRRYTKASLKTLISPFEMERGHYMNIVGFFGWWLNARVSKRDKQSAAQIALFDRAIVPVVSRMESLITPPFGQSLFAVLRKP